MQALTAPLQDVLLAARQGTARSTADHRPWPPPDRSWLMGQSWLDLLFAHWRVDPAVLVEVLPPGMEPETIDGSAWIGITPFEVRALRLRFTLPAPLISSFPELNVRTYVTVDGKPGIYFLSLDAGSRLAVLAARRSYRFPYFHAAMSVRRHAESVEYGSERDAASGPPARFEAVYAPAGEPFVADRSSLEWKLTERYCAYTLDERRRVLRAEIHHRPWELQPATAEIVENTMTAPFGIELEGEPLLHLARRQDVVVWPHEIAANGNG
ncbi:MAG TPA: DUF2071 domain-containing protein [Solirubrobacterales bacterium]|nr:DUF2071 domain-containing protein [Solirubrobacterales bacterium]